MLNFLFFLIIIVLVIVGGVIISILGFFSSIFRRPKREGESETFQNNASKNAKVFTPSEGEYVDFEEVKDDK